MTALFELLLPKRPLSQQASSQSRQDWKDYIYGRAFKIWNRAPISTGGLKFTVVYLCKRNPGDINNMIKPIQDALNALVYADDALVCDVTGHMRLLAEPIDTIGLPDKLAEAIILGEDCVYVRISQSSALNAELRL